VDKSTPDLMKTCASGKHIDKALLTVRKAGGNPLEYIKLEMEQVYIAAVTPGGSHGEERLTENVTLNFHKFKFIYTPQNKDGSGGTAGEVKWDIAANKEA
jgi:type VI secretion system secreted protein Hcp